MKHVNIRVEENMSLGFYLFIISLDFLINSYPVFDTPYFLQW